MFARFTVSKIVFHDANKTFHQVDIEVCNGCAFVYRDSGKLIFGGSNFTFSIESDDVDEVMQFDVAPEATLTERIATFDKPN